MYCTYCIVRGSVGEPVTVLDTARADLSGFHIFRLKECNGDVINDLDDINGLQGFHWQLETALPNLKTNSLNLMLVCTLVIFFLDMHFMSPPQRHIMHTGST